MIGKLISNTDGVKNIPYSLKPTPPMQSEDDRISPHYSIPVEPPTTLEKACDGEGDEETKSCNESLISSTSSSDDAVTCHPMLR